MILIRDNPHHGEYAAAAFYCFLARLHDCQPIEYFGGNRLLADDRNTVDLTAREIDVLHLIAAEKTDKEIAHQLEISERTVRYHLGSVNKKLGTMTRVGAVAEAIRLALIP